MLIAPAVLAVAFVVSAAGAPASAPVLTMPPVNVTVSAAPDMPARLVSALLAEADAVWQSTGVRFVWRREERRLAALVRLSADGPRSAPTLRVIIGHDTHAAHDRQYPLGWIRFDEPTTPEREIYVSYENSKSLLEGSSGVVGAVQSMPALERETYLARAMGRALAHELGHYLSGSKEHTRKGLMMAVHTAAEFFGPDRSRFTLDPAERAQIVARFTSIYMAYRG